MVVQDAVSLEFRVNWGAFAAAPMRPSGGQVFRGEIPGPTTGFVEYRVRALDGAGNAGLSATLSFTASPCDGGPSTYCTAKTHSNGCVPAIGWSGAPSASAGSGFLVTSSNTLDNRSGLFFYSTAGPKQTPFQGGWLCVKAPTRRTSLQNSGGTPPCGGQFAYDFNARIASGADPALVAGRTVWGQYWSRDPQASFHTNCTDAIRFTICP